MPSPVPDTNRVVVVDRLQLLNEETPWKPISGPKPSKYSMRTSVFGPRGGTVLELIVPKDSFEVLEELQPEERRVCAFMAGLAIDLDAIGKRCECNVPDMWSNDNCDGSFNHQELKSPHRIRKGHLQ
jgi:hypothetical protein